MPPLSRDIPTRHRLLAATSLSLLIVVAGCGSQPAPPASGSTPASASPSPSFTASPSPSPSPSPTPTESSPPSPSAIASEAPAQPSELTSNDLLLATLTAGDLAKLLPGETWWPSFPQFNTGFSPYSDGSADGTLKLFVVQSYQRVHASAKRAIQSIVLLYNDVGAASDGLARLIRTNDAGADPIEGATVGDESAMTSRHDTSSSAEYAYTTTLRFRIGPMVARVSVSGPAQTGASTLDSFAAPMIDRMNALNSGALRAQPLPDEVLQLMPPQTSDIGAILGVAKSPPESWALVDTLGKPDVVASKLRSLGVDSLSFGRATLPDDASQVVEATLLPFADAAAATTWVNSFLDGTKAHRLDAGQTGPRAAFTSYDGSFYELQFAVGRFVADVSCYAPFGTTSAACERPVRNIAEAWYARLAKATGEDPAGPSDAPAPSPTDQTSSGGGGAGTDPLLVGSYRCLSRALYYDKGGGGTDTCSGMPALTLSADGSWSWEGETGRAWHVRPVTAADWKGWGIAAYGGVRQVLVIDNLGSGPIEAGGVVWLIYHNTDVAGTVWLKWSRSS